MSIRCLSWNVDTPLPFLPLALCTQKKGQTSITSHFAAAPSISKTKDLKRKRRNDREKDTPPRENELEDAFLSSLTNQPFASSEHTLTHNVFRRMLQRNQWPDLVSLQEIRARPEDTDWIEALALAADTEKYALYTCLNQKSMPKNQRHFGVATFVLKSSWIYPQLNEVRTVDWDHEGRVLIFLFAFKWAFINVYALNGSHHIWKPFKDKNDLQNKTRNERKRDFNDLLTKEVQALQRKGYHVVLMGDFNISLKEIDVVPALRLHPPHVLARKRWQEQNIPNMHMVDAFRHVHGNEARQYSWFSRSKPQGEDCARVDYALVQTSLLDNVKDMSYQQAELDRAHSDHAPFLLSLKNMDQLLDFNEE